MKPILYLSAYTWSKLRFMIEQGETEIGGFCVSSKEFPLYVSDFFLLPQECSKVFFEFNDGSISDYVMDMFTKHNIEPNRCSRIWTHTHPKFPPSPSSVDEHTFAEHCGDNGMKPDWMIMLILAEKGNTYARIRVNGDGVEAEQEMSVEIDWENLDYIDFSESWKHEYKRCVKKKIISVNYPKAPFGHCKGTLAGDERFVFKKDNNKDSFWDTVKETEDLLGHNLDKEDDLVDMFLESDRQKSIEVKVKGDNEDGPGITEL